nr:MAG TPA: hypothetical protein [Caudoviricetes sp.]
MHIIICHFSSTDISFSIAIRIVSCITNTKTNIIIETITNATASIFITCRIRNGYVSFNPIR